MFGFLKWMAKPFVKKIPSVTAFCMKCKDTHPMNDVKEVLLKNGRRSLRGSCDSCGGNVSRISGLVA